MLYEIVSVCKGGGYRYCRTNPPHPKANSNGLYPLHRVLAENKIGRSLEDWEDVHHKDENKENDDPDNLVVLTKSEHAKLHRQPIDPVDVTCPVCSTHFFLKPHEHRLRAKRNASGEVYCSRECGREAQARRLH